MVNPAADRMTTSCFCYKFVIYLVTQWDVVLYQFVITVVNQRVSTRAKSTNLPTHATARSGAFIVYSSQFRFRPVSETQLICTLPKKDNHELNSALTDINS